MLSFAECSETFQYGWLFNDVNVYLLFIAYVVGDSCYMVQTVV